MLTAMLGSKHRGRRKGIAVRQGSVFQARKEAQLTLAEVAGGMVSRTAIHLIETGRTRPSLETLTQIARQTHKPIEYFLLTPDSLPEYTERQNEVRELERLTAVRDFQRVIGAGHALLEKRCDAELTALAHFHVGQAYCRLVRPTEALEHLPLARSKFEQLGDEWMAVEALDWEAAALGLLEDSEALTRAAEALERCRKLDPKPPQTESRILSHIAGMHVVAHSWTQAVHYYQAAVNAASGIRDLLQLAKMHHGLGTAYQRMMQPAIARQHFDKALALYSIEADLSAVYRVENDLGLLLLREGQLESAEQHLNSALAGSNELNIDRRGRGFILTNLGEVNLRKGQLDRARDFLTQAIEAGDAVGERIVLADAHALLGQIEEKESNPAQADRHFAVAIRILDDLEMPERLRDCHMEYAALLEAREDFSRAVQQWKLAAEIGKLAASGLGLDRAMTEAAGSP